MGIATGHLLAQILLTVATVGYGILTLKADFNATHATNPLWTPHARFHVVWQITSYCGFGLIALALIWSAGPLEVERLYLAAAFALIVYGSFFVAVFTRPLYARQALRRERLPALQGAARGGALGPQHDGLRRHGGTHPGRNRGDLNVIGCGRGRGRG